MLALACAMVWLAGCGGGGDDAPAQATTPPAAAGKDYYLWNVASSNWGQWHWLAVVDPAQPDTPRHSILMTGVDGTPALPRGVSGTHLDAAQRRMTMLGTTRLFYLQQGKVYTLDLLKSRNAAPARLSSLSDGCGISVAHAMDAGGGDAWAEIETAGPDGRCDLNHDNRYVAVRTGMDAATPASDLPAGRPWAMTMLPDEHGQALGFLVQMYDRLRFYQPDLKTHVEVANSVSVPSHWELGLFAGERKLYLATWANDGSNALQVRALSYEDGTASLGPTLMTLQSPRAAPLRGDWDTYYFADRRSLYRLTADGPSLLAQYGAGDIKQIAPTQKHVVARLQDPVSQAWSTWSVSKAGGSPLDLATPETSTTGQAYVHWGMAVGDTYFFFSSGNNGLGSLLSVDADGRNPTTWVDGVSMAGALYERSPGPQQWWEQITDVVYCVPQPGRSDCEGGTMKQLHLATHSTTVLGSLPQCTKATRSVRFTFAWGYGGGPFGLGTMLYDDTAGAAAYDLFIATAGSDGSLRAATYNYAAP